MLKAEYSYLSQNINGVLASNGKILVRILPENLHEAWKWIDGNSEGNVTRYSANITKVSLGDEYRAFKSCVRATFIHTLPVRFAKAFVKRYGNNHRDNNLERFNKPSGMIHFMYRYSIRFFSTNAKSTLMRRWWNDLKNAKERKEIAFREGPSRLLV